MLVHYNCILLFGRELKEMTNNTKTRFICSNCKIIPQTNSPKINSNQSVKESESIHEKKKLNN